MEFSDEYWKAEGAPTKENGGFVVGEGVKVIIVSLFRIEGSS